MPKIKHWLYLIFILTIWLISITPRHEVWLIQGLFLTASFIFLFLTFKEKENTKEMLVIGIISRVVLLFSIPNLSDDYIRFIWDGTIQHLGINPYDLRPVEITTTNDHQKLWLSTMNSPEYYSVYPPLCQIIFYIISFSDPGSTGSLFILKLLIIAADIGCYFLLRNILANRKKKSEYAFLYLLNPLVIIELTGNVHFEGIMLFFLLLGIFLIQENRLVLSGFSLGLAVLLKLIPAMIIPAILTNMAIRKSTIIATALATIIVLFSVPYFNLIQLQHMLESIKLYFQHFEYNASIFYLVREAGLIIKGYDIIHITAKIFPFIILFLSIIICLLKIDTYKKCYFILLLYYLFATIVHPWYIIPLLGMAILAGELSGLVWSLAVFLSYTSYTIPFYEKPIIILIEYSILISSIIFDQYYHRLKNEKAF